MVLRHRRQRGHQHRAAPGGAARDHGLGFQTFTSGSTGNYNSGFPSIADRYLYDTVDGLHWNQNTAAQRVASAISIDKLAWDGPAVNKQAMDFLGPRPVLVINAPGVIAGTYAVQTATFGAALTLGGATGNVVLADDGVAPNSDGCWLRDRLPIC